jgi:hypothetical protein
MQDALAAHHLHASKGTLPTRGEKAVEGWTPNIWHRYGVKKASFYLALQWESKNPGQVWSGANIRMRGKMSLLTPTMEDKLSHWIAISQRQSGGVEKDAVCRVGYALMASDPHHFARVQAQHPEYRN